MSALMQFLFHLVCRKDTAKPDDYDENYFRAGFDSTALFFRRLDNRVDFIGKRALDVGCGYGSTCIYMALHGAQQVVGIDINEDRIAFANAKLRSEYSSLTNKVDFKLVTNPKQLEGKKFDLILSKDSFEHIENPEKYIKELQEYLADNGRLVIGFGPLWKSPYGGHIDYMSSLPWAHLLFPESVIMHERKHFRPDEDAHTFEEVKGGLNKMTLKKFKDILGSSNLEPLYFKTNVHDRKLTKLFNILRRLPYCEEYFTFNLYSIWRVKGPNSPGISSSRAKAIKVSQ
jgi:SAM-dependent methyltransferase